MVSCVNQSGNTFAELKGAGQFFIKGSSYYNHSICLQSVVRTLSLDWEWIKPHGIGGVQAWKPEVVVISWRNLDPTNLHINPTLFLIVRTNPFYLHFSA